MVRLEYQVVLLAEERSSEPLGVGRLSDSLVGIREKVVDSLVVDVLLDCAVSIGWQVAATPFAPPLFDRPVTRRVVQPVRKPVVSGRGQTVSPADQRRLNIPAARMLSWFAPPRESQK